MECLRFCKVSDNHIKNSALTIKSCLCNEFDRLFTIFYSLSSGFAVVLHYRPMKPDFHPYHNKLKT